MLFISGILLLYTAIVVPAQIFLWDYTDLCSKFPTLYFDAFVDIFFMVPGPQPSPVLAYISIKRQQSNLSKQQS
jgi:hypothetical protein